MTTTTVRRGVRAKGLALGFIGAAALSILMAPHAAADTKSDAQDAITKLADQISSGSADRGHNNSGLGAAQGTITPVGDGFSQAYAGGVIYWSEKDGAKVVYGAISDKYTAEGGPTGSLGFPTESEGAAADLQPAGRVASFAAADKPKIYWTPENGAWVVRGPFSAATDKLGAELGAPVADLVTNGDEMSQKFTNGTLTFNKATGEWTSVPASWAPQLKGLAIPGMPNMSMPNMSMPNMSASAPALPSVSAPSVSAPSTSSSGGFNWWWLLIPFLLILAGLLLAWLLRNRRKPVAGGTPDAHLRRPAVSTPTPPAAPAAPTATGVDLKTTAAGTAAAAAAGAAAAGAAMKARSDKTEHNVVPDADATTSSQYGEHSPEPSPEAYHSVGDSDTTTHGLVGGATAAGAGAAAAGAAAAGAAGHGHGDGVGTYLKGGVETPVPVGAHLPLEDRQQAPEGYPIKGNADSGLYHTPDLPSYQQTIAEIWFATESAAEAAGFKRVGS